MKRRSLNHNILRLVVGLVILTSLTIVFNVWSSINQQASQQLERELQVGENVLLQALENRASQLYSSASVLTADFGFKQAIATRDNNTIESVLLNHGQRIDADLMMVFSLSGDVEVSSQPFSDSGRAIIHQDLLSTIVNEGGATVFLFINDRLFQTMLLTVNAPAPIAIALIGFEVDKLLVQQLQSLIQLETSIHVSKSEGQSFWVSTLTSPESAISATEEQMNWFSLFKLQPQQYVSRHFVLSNDYGLEVKVVLSSELTKLFKGFQDLQLNISVIAVLAVMLAVIMAWWLSQKLARPISELAERSSQIARGDYKTREQSASELQEVHQLSEAFSLMQASVQEREQHIRYQATHDALTQLYNRAYIEQWMQESFQTNTSFQVLGINVFGFRNINDTFGYTHGDACLKVLAQRVSSEKGIAARLTGGELLLLPDSPMTLEQLYALKEQLEVQIEQDNIRIPIKVTIGVLECPSDAASPEQLFRRLNIVLDEALTIESRLLRYQALFEERYLYRVAMISELRKALDEDTSQFSMFYQPKLNLARDAIEGAEALIRWNNPALGFVSPEDFINVAEQAGLICQLTDWVLEQVLQDVSLLLQANINLHIAINLSARDLMLGDLPQRIQLLLDRYQLTNSHVGFEITESDLVKNPEEAIAQLQILKDKGFALSLDDFGTGYSSMAYLKSLPLNILKIDKAFVLNLDADEDDQTLVKTMLQLATALGLEVVAEGVENEIALQLLNTWGCQWAQGYFIAKPMSLEQLQSWYQQHQQTKWLSL